jgi:hypothetical protein
VRDAKTAGFGIDDLSHQLHALRENVSESPSPMINNFLAPRLSLGGANSSVSPSSPRNKLELRTRSRRPLILSLASTSEPWRVFAGEELNRQIT